MYFFLTKPDPRYPIVKLTNYNKLQNLCVFVIIVIVLVKVKKNIVLCLIALKVMFALGADMSCCGPS